MCGGGGGGAVLFIVLVIINQIVGTPHDRLEKKKGFFVLKCTF